MTRGYINSHARIKVNPLEPGLVGGWDMKQDVAGTVFDKSGEGYDGTIYDLSQGSDLLCDSLKYSAGYMDLGSSANLVPAVASYVFWIKPDDLTGDHQIFSNSGATFADTNLEIKTNGSSLEVVASNGTATAIATATGLALNQWNLIAGLVDGNDLRAYVNGSFGSIATLTGTRSSAAVSTKFGKRTFVGSEQYFSGNIGPSHMLNYIVDGTYLSNQYALGKTALFQTMPPNNTGTVTSGNIGDSPLVVDYYRSGGFAVVDEPDPNTLKPDTITNGDFSLWTDPTVPDGWLKDGTHDASNYVEEDVNGMQLVSAAGAYFGVYDAATVEVGKPSLIAYDIHSITGSIKIVNGSQEHEITAVGKGSYILTPAGPSTAIIIARTSGYTTDAVIASVSVQPITSYMKAIECITAGVCYVPTSLFQQTPTEAARGHLEFWCYKASTASDINVQFIGEMKGSTYSAGQYGYALSFNTDERIVLREVANGVASNLMYTAVGTVPIAQWFKIKIDMSSITGFGIYLNDSLVTAAFGTNPILDTTYTESMYITIDKDAGDKISLESVIKRLLP